MSQPPALSGIVKTDNQAIVPASRRPDGTFRKEIKIRPGYTPPEDVARYSNERLDSARVVKPEYPPGYTPPANEVTTTKKSKNQKKNERKKAKKAEAEAGGKEKEEQEEEEEKNEETDDRQAEPEPKAKATAAVTAQESSAQESPALIDPQKKLKALEKKLRQAEQLKEKQTKGEALLPEQLEKIGKMAELVAEINKLKMQ